MIGMGENLPVRIFIFSPNGWKSNSPAIKAYTYENATWKCISNKKIPQLIYDRFTAKAAGENQAYTRLVMYLTKNKFTFCNPLPMANLMRNKLQFHQFLVENDIPTLHGFSIEDATNPLIDKWFEYNDTIYIKPIEGSGGKGISLIINQNSNYYLKTSSGTNKIEKDKLMAILHKTFESNSYFIQPKARTRNYKGAPYDIRVLIQNDGNDNYLVTGMAVRLGQINSWVSNLDAGGRGVALDELQNHFIDDFGLTTDQLKDKIESICKACSNALVQYSGRYAEIALDILLTDDYGPLIIEGNSKPARWIFNSIACNYDPETPEYKKFKALRKKTVIFPLKFAIKSNF